MTTTSFIKQFKMFNLNSYAKTNNARVTNIISGCEQPTVQEQQTMKYLTRITLGWYVHKNM